MHVWFFTGVKDTEVKYLTTDPTSRGLAKKINGVSYYVGNTDMALTSFANQFSQGVFLVLNKEVHNKLLSVVHRPLQKHPEVKVFIDTEVWGKPTEVVVQELKLDEIRQRLNSVKPPSVFEFENEDINNILIPTLSNSRYILGAEISAFSYSLNTMLLSKMFSNMAFPIPSHIKEVGNLIFKDEESIHLLFDEEGKINRSDKAAARFIRLLGSYEGWAALNGTILTTDKYQYVVRRDFAVIPFPLLRFLITQKLLKETIVSKIFISPSVSLYFKDEYDFVDALRIPSIRDYTGIYFTLFLMGYKLIQEEDIFSVSMTNMLVRGTRNLDGHILFKKVMSSR